LVRMAPVESSVKWVLAQRAGFVCRHRLIINRIAMVRGDIAFIA